MKCNSQYVAMWANENTLYPIVWLSHHRQRLHLTAISFYDKSCVCAEDVFGKCHWIWQLNNNSICHQLSCKSIVYILTRRMQIILVKTSSTVSDKRFNRLFITLYSPHSYSRHTICDIQYFHEEFTYSMQYVCSTVNRAARVELMKLSLFALIYTAVIDRFALEVSNN